MSKHTPGPWFANSGGQVWSDRLNRPANALADVYSCTANERGQDEERNANARLIAAAPEMLEALRAALPGLESEGFDSAEIVRVAIAKATGGGK